MSGCATSAVIENLTKIYRKPGDGRGVHALRPLNLEFREGEYTAIMGPAVGQEHADEHHRCLDKPTGGRYILGDVDVGALPDDELSEIRSARIGFIFQQYNLIQQLTVLENLEVPMFYLGVPPKERRRRAMALAERVGMAERVDHRPMQLSGGSSSASASPAG
jgi:putative ABC transport system ATP-binding protein